MIEYVAPAAAPWIKVVQAAYGAMKFVRDVYTDTTLESLYQQYKKLLDEKGPDAAAAWWMQQGENKLGAYNRPRLQDRPNAPDQPVKFRLTRRGDEFTGDWSLDGKNWTLFLRETILLPDTLWVGGVFNRMTWDRQPNEKATFTLSDVKLVTGERGKLARPDWHFVQAEGTATATGKTVRLSENCYCLHSHPPPELHQSS